MPIRQMKESSEQHLVIKAQANNPMNQVQKASKTSQNGKGLPPQEPPQNAKQPSHNPSPAKNRSRRRGRGVPKAGQCDTLSGLKSPTTYQIPSGCLENASHLGEPERGFPSSSKSLRFPPRPGLGQAGTRCIVKANHFFAELPDKDLIHYDVNITPEVASKNVNRSIIAELVKLYRESDLGMRLPAYDGRKSLYTAGELPFSYREFNIKLVDEEVGINGPKYYLVGRSFFSPEIKTPQRLGNGLESWRGFYQSIRPTQMGLSLNIDMSTAAFIEPLPVIEFVAQLLGKDALLRPFSDSNHVKVKKALRGVKVEVTHRGHVRRKYRISGLTSQPTRELM